MASAPVHCRLCKKLIYKDKEVENVDWMMPSRNYYYHCKCYNDWKRGVKDIHSDITDDAWYLAVKEYLSKDLKAPIDYAKVASQWKNLLKKGKTPKGIYFSLRYFYDIKKNDVSKCEGGIGIVNYIYEDACQYWVERNDSENGIIAKIEAQVMAKQNQQLITMIRAAHKNSNLKFNLEDIGMEDDE